MHNVNSSISLSAFYKDCGVVDLDIEDFVWGIQDSNMLSFK